MTEAAAQINQDGSGKKAKYVMLRGVPQEDGTSVDVTVLCVSVTDLDGRGLDNEAVLDALVGIRQELARMRKGWGDYLDNAEMMLDVSDEDDGGDDDGGES